MKDYQSYVCVCNKESMDALKVPKIIKEMIVITSEQVFDCNFLMTEHKHLFGAQDSELSYIDVIAKAIKTLKEELLID